MSAASTSSSIAKIFILHWNRSRACLATVEQFQKYVPSYPLTIIDNASVDLERAALRRGLPAGVEWIQLGNNLGWGGAFNRALQNFLRESAEDYAIVCAHDVRVSGDTIGRCLDAMRESSTLGIVSPEYGENRLPKWGGVTGVVSVRPIPFPTSGPVFTNVVNGTLMIMRKSCLNEIGLFDERYFAYGDEHELSLRANKMGWKTAVVAGALMQNPETATPKPMVTYLCARNSLILAYEYGGFVRGLVRESLMVCNNIRITIIALLTANDLLLQQAWARWRAVYDYSRSAFGWSDNK